jgi:hypothetical protein
MEHAREKEIVSVVHSPNTQRFPLLSNPLTNNTLPKHAMLPVQMRSSSESDKKLTPIRIRSTIRHSEQSLLVAFILVQILIFKFISVDGARAGAITLKLNVKFKLS